MKKPVTTKTRKPDATAGDQIMLPAQYREAQIVAGSVNAEQRTFDIVWTAGAEVPRMDWWTGQRYIEVLDVSASSIRLDRLQSGRAPVLNAHSRYELGNVMGVIEGNSIKIEGGLGYARARMSAREDVAPLVADIRDGIITNISPGYITHSYREEMRDGVMYRIATDWEPIEISFVPVGADPDAGRRAAPEGATYPCKIVRSVEQSSSPAVDRDEDGQAGLARMRMRQLAIEAAK
jgi:hypothetical protein